MEEELVQLKEIRDATWKILKILQSNVSSPSIYWVMGELYEKEVSRIEELMMEDEDTQSLFRSKYYSKG